MPADRVPSRIDPTIRLSRRQVEVAYLLTLGLSVKEAAHRLGSSYHTTCAHLRLAMRRLEVHNRAALLRAALPPAPPRHPRVTVPNAESEATRRRVDALAPAQAAAVIRRTP